MKALPLCTAPRRIGDYLAARAEVERTAWQGGPEYEAACDRLEMALTHIGAETPVVERERA